MNALLDVLGSVFVGTLLILMMLTFQTQLNQTSQRILYVASMVDHMDQAANRLNKIIAQAGIGIPPDSVCVTAGTSNIVFKTYWNCESDTLTNTRQTIEMKIHNITSPYGKALVITQNGTPLKDTGYILYIESMALKYYDKNDILTTTPSQVRSVEMLLTFRRDYSSMDKYPLRSNIQVKCFFMNCYLQEG